MEEKCPKTGIWFISSPIFNTTASRCFEDEITRGTFDDRTLSMARVTRLWSHWSPSERNQKPYLARTASCENLHYSVLLKHTLFPPVSPSIWMAIGGFFWLP